jgi:hypothetical protein
MANEEYILTSASMKEAQEREWEYRHKEEQRTIDKYNMWTGYATRHLRKEERENGCS